MSSSDLYRVSKTTARHVAEFRNGSGTGPVIWGHMLVHYLGRDPHSWLFPEDDNKALWALPQEMSIPIHLRLAMLFTYDGAVCPCGRAGELADALSKAWSDTNIDKPDWVNHWLAVSHALRKAEPHHRAIGFGLSCTSVSDPWCDYHGTAHDREPWDLFTGLPEEEQAAQ